jgi:hypothetical protein
MSKASLSSLIVLGAALAACSGSDTSRTVTAPDAGPAFSEALDGISVSYTLDGPDELVLPSEDASTMMAASVQASSGSRASGHVGFPTGWPNTPILSEQYSFTALSTSSATPLSAKGRFEVTLNNAGTLQTIEGDVICINTFGTTARVGAQITAVWINGVPTPINPLRTHALWVVVDNGEGAANPDQVSLVRFGPAIAAQTYCATGFSSQVTANQEGNIQVQP